MGAIINTETDFNPKIFAVIGVGPVGAIVAAFLAKGGKDVVLCDIKREQIEPAIDRGIIIEGAENIQSRVSNICFSVEDLAKYDPDVIFVSVKANALRLIGALIANFYRKGMYIVSWQNGIDTEQELAVSIEKKGIMRAVVNYGCGLMGPCHIDMEFHHPPHFIQSMDLKEAEKSAVIAKILTDCGLETVYTDRIIDQVWRKSILNACMNPVCAITGMTMYEVMNDPIVRQIVESLVKECAMVARLNEIKLGNDFFFKYVMEYMSDAGNHKPSMLVDIEEHRKTEVDFMNGKFIEYGSYAGIDTPYNKTIKSLIKGLEKKLSGKK